jgi:hypothetical protein
MNAVERLEAAIGKLETLKAESTPGRWDVDRVGFGVRAFFDNEFNGNTLICEVRHGKPDADLIVTLHRTIDAQLAILRSGRNITSRESEYTFDLALALADAILGGA